MNLNYLYNARLLQPARLQITSGGVPFGPQSLGCPKTDGFFGDLWGAERRGRADGFFDAYNNS